MQLDDFLRALLFLFSQVVLLFPFFLKEILLRLTRK